MAPGDSRVAGSAVRTLGRPVHLTLRGKRMARSEVADLQRLRLLTATVSAIDELGYTDTTVSDIIARSRVSRRTFYGLFANRDACLVAVLEDVVGQVEDELAAAALGDLEWRERVRRGLWTILAFFDCEPALARVCVVQAPRGGPEALALRAEIFERLTGVIDEGRLQGARGERCSPLTAEGLVGATFTILYTRVQCRERKPLTDLLGELMAMIVLPYLGPGAARTEQTRAAPAPSPAAVSRGSAPIASSADCLQGVPMRLTYRTARVLECIAERPGASNRAVADYAGIADQGQISKLLRRLERLDLTVNTGAGRAAGEPNAWRLTPLGQEVAHSIRVLSRYRSEAA
jgi:AcrR family transcriptional regulator/DNA-binding MarR family transcriptional regulator